MSGVGAGYTHNFLGFPRATKTSVAVRFYRILGEPITAGLPASQQVMMQAPNRFPTDIMKIDDRYVQTKLGGYGDLWTKEDIDDWISLEFMNADETPWDVRYASRSLAIAVLPEVEIPPVFKYDPYTFCAVSWWGGLGFVNTNRQHCWEELSFDSEPARTFRKIAGDHGWDFTEYKYDSRNGFERGDDGGFDQLTHAFYPGARRCAWCGSSSITPRFLYPYEEKDTTPYKEECMACRADGENVIDDRTHDSMKGME